MTVTWTSSPISSSITVPKMMLASGWATPWMISAAAFISNRPMLDGPVMLSRMPRAPSIADSSSGLLIACLAADTARLSPLACPMPISAEPALDSTILTSAKSVLIRPGVVIRLVMPETPWSSTSSAILNALSTLVFSLATRQQAVVGDDDQRVDLLLQPLHAVVGLHRAAAALERERAGDDADRQRTGVAGDLGDHRRGAGARAAALAGGDEHHVGALDHLVDLVAVGLGCGAADLGIAAGAEPAGEVAADVELDVGVAHEQRLRVGVDGDELDTLQAGVDHAIDGVDTATADADHLDDGEIVLGRAGHQRYLRRGWRRRRSRGVRGRQEPWTIERGLGRHPGTSEPTRAG